MTDFPALIAACESATGPLDDNTLGRVVCAITGQEFVSVKSSGLLAITTNSGRYYWGKTERPDVSMNTVLALMRRAGFWVSSIVQPYETAVACVSDCYGIARTWPLAILAAGLRAAQAREMK